ncbi:glutathione S-transferase family protein [Roseateles sp. DB2]|uniref:glutathione S-transferase family protein n=1 Tax=Roseateles sp. DB2 TaxID=3453717 RepID=UPI003EEC0767
MLSLYHTPESRSSRIIWLLEELGLEYDLIHCEIQLSDGSGSPDPKNPHPEKRVPALQHEGQLVTEQSAIALYLTDAFPAKGLGVQIGEANRAAYLSWLVFYASEVDPLYTTRKYYRDRLHPKTVKDSQRVVSRVSEALAKGPYLLGNQFTAADILVSGPLEWSLAWDPDYVSKNELIMNWLKRLADRPAAQRALALDEPAEAAN